MQKIIDFIKNEIVFSIALVLAIISAFIIRPSKDYINYIDFRTLALLLALMLVVQGFSSIGVFNCLVEALLTRIKTKRALAFMMISLCFFGSMLITNDVALITFVPFTIMLLSLIEDSKFSIYLIVLETIAANLGSMFTPIGNPQNLYLYSISHMNIGGFLLVMLPYTLASFIILIFCVMFIKAEPISQTNDTQKKISISKLHLSIYCILFLICILTVLHIVDYKIMLVLVSATIFLINKKLLLKADYILLLTFVAFFIFIGNMKNIPAINDFLSSLVTGRECYVSILASQVVSNVPAAMLLSGFTTAYDQLIIGTNLGGLGTIIASMASLISFKFYNKTKASNTAKYMLTFTLLNVIFLFLLVILYILLNI